MRKFTLLLALVLTGYASMSQQSDLWTPVNESSLSRNLFTKHLKPAVYQVYQLNEPSIQRELRNSPSERKVGAAQSSLLLSVPVPGGRTERFQLWWKHR
jgi:hypothetical protein